MTSSLPALRVFGLLLALSVVPLAAQANQVLQMSNAANDGFFDVPASPSLAPANITVEGWITYDETTLAPGAGFRWPTVARKNIAAGQEEWMLRVQAASTAQRTLTFVVRTLNGNVGANWTFGAGRLLAATHVAGTYDGSAVRLYIDGVEVASSPASGPLQDLGGDLRVGGGDTAAPENWNGTIDELRIWSVARTPAEINSTLYSSTLGAAPGLEANYSLEGVALDFTGNGNDGAFTGVGTFVNRPFPSILFQTNSPEASLDINGVQGSAGSPARSTSAVCALDTITIDSNVMPTSFEVLLAPGTLTPAALTTPGNQILNVNLATPGLAFLNGGAALAFAPFPGTFVIPAQPPTPILLSGQAGFLDASSPDGFRLSQGVEWERVASTGPIAGPTSDDGVTLVDLGTAGCGAVDINGSSYTQVGINANGRLSFGGTDGDFSATVAEAQTDLPFLGFWTDLNVANGGSITATDTGSLLRIDYAAVPYFGETTTVSFAIVIDRTMGTFTVDGLTGVALNPATGVTGSDGTFLGFSPGNSATGGSALDAGAIDFSTGGGTSGSADEMIYDFSAGGAAGTPFSVTSLAGGINTVSFLGTGGGPIAWFAF